VYPSFATRKKGMFTYVCVRVKERQLLRDDVLKKNEEMHVVFSSRRVDGNKAKQSKAKKWKQRKGIPDSLCRIKKRAFYLLDEHLHHETLLCKSS